ncbi:adenosylcobinamide-phosphate synthase CbiB [Paenibacillus sp. P96]|uniref:Cobalamin biosynthesis protein CobD n=1 Tax=Paenibacillus zeirhizosphaerae TaxID=2987519 RepID=A0ABT9FLA1_9BACL|nr:adenosylcobinamide-phosphate synthase CbiB [Paenibacillus sp. P96]MDP4095306.1 adenosylcobinamide-phosphate synthase CbiB [Paenibacillus sp. P96]
MTGSLIILAAYILDRIIGDPRWIPHPVIGMGKLISLVESGIRRYARSAVVLRWAGLLLPLIVVGAAYLLTWLTVILLGKIHPWLAIGAEVLLIATTIATKGLKDAGIAVYKELRSGDLPAARAALGMIVGRDTKELDEPEIVRGTVETIAENIVDAIISPLFYALIGGAPLAMAYRAVNTLDSMVGYKNEKYIHLGWASARLDDAANFIPARLTAILLVAAAWLKRLEPLRSWLTVWRDARLHPSPNSGFPESAVAGALGVRLGGYNVYHGVRSFRAYMGDPTRQFEEEDIRRTVALMFLSSWLFVLLCLAAEGIVRMVMLL